MILLEGVAAPQAQEARFVTIGTGSVTGVDYPAGGAICRLVNAGRRDHGIRCTAQATDGSVENIRALRAGELDFGIVASDVQHQARRGTGPFKGAPGFGRSRAVFSWHAEPLTILAPGGAGIATLRDLAGKRIGIGNPGSAPRITFGRLMGVLGWTRRSFAAALELPSAEQAQALLDDRLDAAAFVVAHPDSALDRVTRISDGALIEVSGRAVNRLVARTPFYAEAVIPGGTYRGTDADVRSFGRPW